MTQTRVCVCEKERERGIGAVFDPFIYELEILFLIRIFARQFDLLLYSSNVHVFLVVNKRIYKRLCPSVRWSIGPSVGLLVRPLPIKEFKPKSDLTSINAPAQRLQLIWSCIRPCSTVKSSQSRTFFFDF